MSFNLLIVDDEAPIRKGLSEHIKWEDYDCKVVATANNGEDAIAKINDALQYTALNFFMNLFMSAPVTVLFFQFIHNC